MLGWMVDGRWDGNWERRWAPERADKQMRQSRSDGKGFYGDMQDMFM